MRELRKDYLLNRWVIINTERSKRPVDFEKNKDETPQAPAANCAFCPGNEHLTPPEITRVEENGKWIMRVVPNKFPAVSSDVDSKIVKKSAFFTCSQAYGKHEVLIETPDHNEQLADFSVDRLKMLLDLYCSRINTLSNDPRIKEVAVFKNEGKEAGCSLSHPHTQIIAYNKLAQTIDEKLHAASSYKAKYGKCPYCEVSRIEMKGDRRVYENGHMVIFAPYASRFAFEVRISPKRHVNRITELNSDERRSLADAIRFVLLKLKQLNAPYNMYLRNAPVGKFLHFHVKINPRLLIWGGFEYEAGCVINTVSPEDAAKYYRGET